jgi:mono/diheme cytochrome c family protein
MNVMIIKTGLMAAGFSAIVLFAAATNGANADGKSIFTTNKCNVCHSISAQGITKTNDKSKAPDLSGVGAQHNADWIAKFINKETDLNGKQHGLKFKGSPDELKAVASWLGQQKKK